MIDMDYILNGKQPKKDKGKKQQSKDPFKDLFDMVQPAKRPKGKQNQKPSVGNLNPAKIMGVGNMGNILGDKKTKKQNKLLNNTKMKSGKGHKRFADWDKDGVINGLDCAPMNPMKHRLIKGKNFPAQLHSSANPDKEFDAGQIEPETSDNFQTNQMIKPRGTFWTSSIKKQDDNKLTSNWEDWVEGEREERKYPRQRFKVRPTRDAKIYSIQDSKDYDEFEEKYVHKGAEPEGHKDKFKLRKFQQDFDALHVDEKFIDQKRLTSEPGNKMASTWDSESTQWFKPKFRKVEKIDDTDENYKKFTDNKNVHSPYENDDETALQDAEPVEDMYEQDDEGEDKDD